MTSFTVGADPSRAPIALSQAAFLARCAARPAERNALIDVARGLALIGILIPHFTLIAIAIGDLGGLRAPYLSDFQFVDEAELFVFFSGYVNGLADGQRAIRDGYKAVIRQTVRRIWQIFRAILFTVALAVALSWPLFSDRAILAGLDMLPFEENGRSALAAIATLAHSTLFINILALYLLLFATTPLFIWGFRTNAAGMAIASATVWLLVQLGPLHVTGNWAGVASFNPFAWQALFAMGVFLGMQHGFDTLVAGLSRRHLMLLVAICLGFFALRTGLRVSPWLAEAARPFWHKGAFAPLRVANFVAFVPLFMLAVGWFSRALPSLARLVGRAGAMSLEMFCAGVVLSLLMAFAFVTLGGSVTAYAIALTGGLVVYLLLVPPLEYVS